MRPRKIAFIDRNGKLCLECKLSSMPLDDRKIIEKSIELFNDAEPCIIHRSFVMKKMLLEIDEYFNEVLPDGRGQIVCDSIPKSIRDLLCISGDVVKFQLD